MDFRAERSPGQENRSEFIIFFLIFFEAFGNGEWHDKSTDAFRRNSPAEKPLFGKIRSGFFLVLILELV